MYKTYVTEMYNGSETTTKILDLFVLEVAKASYQAADIAPKKDCFERRFVSQHCKDTSEKIRRLIFQQLRQT